MSGRSVSLALALALAAVLPAAGEPLPIRIAWTAVPADLSPVLVQKKELFDRLGQSYTVEHVHFAQAATVLRALAAGEIDIASFSPIEFGVAIQNAGLEDIRVIGDGYEDGAIDHYSDEFMVLADGTLRTIDDLAGKAVAVDAFGDMDDIGARLLLRRHGLGEDVRTRVVEASFANMGAMLEARKIDAAGLAAPFSYAVAAKLGVRTLFRLKDAFGASEARMLVARRGFLDANRAALADFFADYVRALRWFLAPAHRNEATVIVAEFTRAPQSVYADYLFTENDYRRDADARPDLAALQRNLDALREAGFLAVAIDARRYADLTFVDEASRRLQ